MIKFIMSFTRQFKNNINRQNILINAVIIYKTKLQIVPAKKIPVFPGDPQLFTITKI
jgi:hypothetical protein